MLLSLHWHHCCSVIGDSVAICGIITSSMVLLSPLAQSPPAVTFPCQEFVSGWVVWVLDGLLYSLIWGWSVKLENFEWYFYVPLHESLQTTTLDWHHRQHLPKCRGNILEHRRIHFDLCCFPGDEVNIFLCPGVVEWLLNGCLDDGCLKVNLCPLLVLLTHGTPQHQIQVIL